LEVSRDLTLAEVLQHRPLYAPAKAQKMGAQTVKQNRYQRFEGLTGKEEGAVDCALFVNPLQFAES
jgi:hypothetical protein